MTTDYEVLILDLIDHYIILYNVHVYCYKAS